jgi:cytochrome c biogenesis protein CcmG, thiol:disulfide interchange protein DsbE
MSLANREPARRSVEVDRASRGDLGRDRRVNGQPPTGVLRRARTRRVGSWAARSASVALVVTVVAGGAAAARAESAKTEDVKLVATPAAATGAGASADGAALGSTGGEGAASPSGPSWTPPGATAPASTMDAMVTAVAAALALLAAGLFGARVAVRRRRATRPLRAGTSPRGRPRPPAVHHGLRVFGLAVVFAVVAGGALILLGPLAGPGVSQPPDVAYNRDLDRAGPRAARTAGALAQDLAGSPGPLAELHRQAGELLGTDAGFTTRLRALRGYPIVVNVWASWCTPCRSELSLFAAASVHYGRHVAFLGADTDDSAGDARAFLAQHPVRYPSYRTSESSLTPLAALEGLPTTIYLNAAGKVVHVHVGQYISEGALDQDINSYALAG